MPDTETNNTKHTPENAPNEEKQSTIGSTIHGSMAILSFSVIAWLFDLINVTMFNLQIALFKSLVAAWPVTLGVSIGVGLLNIISTEAQEITKATIGFVFGFQALLSVTTFCFFIFIAATSPRGYFSTTDYFIALGVCIAESIPFISTYAFWGTFSVFLRRKLVRRSLEKSSFGSIGSSIAKVFGKK